MISSIRATAVSYVGVGAAAPVGVGSMRSSHLGVDYVVVETHAEVLAARAAAADVDRLAGAVLDERVAARERPLGVVRRQRQRQPL